MKVFERIPTGFVSDEAVAWTLDCIRMQLRRCAVCMVSCEVFSFGEPCDVGNAALRLHYY